MGISLERRQSYYNKKKDGPELKLSEMAPGQAEKFMWAADFETTTQKNFDAERRVRVMMWGLMSLDKKEYYRGTTIESFISKINEISARYYPYQMIVYLHNLKFDLSFIENHVVADLEYKVETNVDLSRHGKCISTLRDSMNIVYASDLKFAKYHSVKFVDSAKMFPNSLKKLGETFKVEKLVGNMDFSLYYPIFYEPTKKEWDYLYNDCEIVAVMMRDALYKNNGFYYTRSSAAYSKLKRYYNREQYEKGREDKDLNLSGKKANIKTPFELDFPATNVEEFLDLSKAYSGGITYVNPKYVDKVVGKGYAVDINSSYPASMHDKTFPIYESKKFYGTYEEQSEEFKSKYKKVVYIFKSKFKLKKDGFPCLPKQLSNNVNRRDVILSHNDVKDDYIYLCDVDFKHFKINYDIKKIEFFGGYAFQETKHPFRTFIGEVYETRLEAKEDGDDITQMNEKLTMNSSYGKFGQKVGTSKKFVTIDEKGCNRYLETSVEYDEKNYLPMAIWITAWSRDTLLNMIYAVGMDKFTYCDTDSVHFTGEITPDVEKLLGENLGEWGFDAVFNSAKYLRSKCYIEECRIYDKKKKVYLEETKFEVKCAGLSDDAKKTITHDENGNALSRDEVYNNFFIGGEYAGGTRLTQVFGGCLIVDVVKTLHPVSDSVENIVEDDIYTDFDFEVLD